MITPQVKDTKVVFGPCRLSYVHVFSKYDPENKGDGKYMTNVLIPKSEKETIKALQTAIETAKQSARSGAAKSRKSSICLCTTGTIRTMKRLKTITM